MAAVVNEGWGAAGVATAFARALAGACRAEAPFRHWLLTDALPPGVAPALAELHLPPPPADTQGKRETHNAKRSYCNVENRHRFPVVDALARAFQGRTIVDAVEQVCGLDLGGTSLRIEYCQDTEGFWLEPHTDIGAKRFTLIIGLSDGPDSAGWGTDLYDLDRRPVARSPYGCNRALAFVPSGDTWHGFERRPIRGVRRSLIVNYVGPEWRSRDELAFPNAAIRQDGDRWSAPL
jgi:hypothetical protein